LSKVIITGATGFIGAPLVKKFINNGDEVYALIRPDSPNLHKFDGVSGVEVLPLDIRDVEKASEYLEHAEYFIHAAWEGIRGEARQDIGLQKQNYENALKAAQTAKKLGCKAFLGIGSQAEYGITEQAITEEVLEEPVTEYGRRKLETCKTLQQLYTGSDMRILWARVFSAYGPGDTPNSLIDICIRDMKQGNDLLLTECIQNWNYIYIDDAVEAIYRLITNEDCVGIYNIASKDNRSLKEYVLELKSLLKSESVLRFGAIPYGAVGPTGFSVDIEKLCTMLQWEPEVSFAEGIQKKIRIEERHENN